MCSMSTQPVTGFVNSVLNVVRVGWLFVVLIGALLALRIWAAASPRTTTDKALLLGYAGFVTAIMVFVTGFWRRWVFWRRPTAAEASTAGQWLFVLYATMASFALTEMFSFATLLSTSARDLPVGNAIWAVEQHYVWHFAKELPVLDPEDFGTYCRFRGLGCQCPGRGGQRPPSDSIASAMTACCEW
jgi:hypothetical protein